MSIEHWAFMLTATTSSQKQSEHPAASSVMLTMANRKDKCYLCVCVFFLFHSLFDSCSKGDDSHENLIDWGNLFEFPQLVFAAMPVYS